MSKQSLLLVDGDARSLRVLEVSLRKAGFLVTAAQSVQDALDKLELHAPDLIISETTFPDGDGFELPRRVRATPEWAEIPFIFLTAEAAIENKIRGLELGVDDYLTKPIYIKEIVTRIHILLQKRQRVRFEERRDGKTRFAGRVQDMPVVDVIQTIEISRKSGVIQFVGERGRQAAIYFRDGRVIDAEAGSLQGEDAVYRLLTWSEGEFEVVFRTVRRREVITISSQGLLMEGMRRLDEWSRLFEQLPPLTHRFEVDTSELAARLGDVPDDNNRILRLFDGKRTLLEVIDASDVGDLECLQAISRLYFEELLIDLDPNKAPRRDTGKPVAAAEPAQLVERSEPSMGDPFEDDPMLDAPPSPAAEGEPEPPPTSEPDVRDEDDLEVPQAARAAEPPPDDDLPGLGVGALMGGYRPSSLRLIDEAVAAAQAIEPTLGDDVPLAPPETAAEARLSRGAESASEDEASADEPLRADEGEAAPAEPTPTERAGATDAESIDDAPVRLTAAEREESGLRMIGSLGRDRAEASGELPSMGRPRPLRSETARELVTILPRRITREMPAIPAALTESLPTPTPTTAVLAPRPVAVPAAELPVPVLGPSPSRTTSSTLRAPLAGTGVRAQSRSRRLLRVANPENGGPGLGAVLLIVLAAVLAGAAVLLRLRRHAGTADTVEQVRDATSATTVTLPVGDDVPTPGGAKGSERAAARSLAPTDEGTPSPGTRPIDPGHRLRGANRGSGADGAARPGELTEPSAPAPAAGARAPEGAAARSSTDMRRAPGGDGGVPAAVGGSGAGAAMSMPGRDGAGGAAVGGSAPGAAPSVPGREGAGGAASSSTLEGATRASETRTEPSVAGAGRRARDADDEREAQARAFYDQAQVALEAKDAPRALELADASLRLRRTMRTYLVRARALQQLDRLKDALAALDAAGKLAPEAAAVWETRGWILWAARRRDEARVAFARSLEMDPASPRAASIRRLLNEPR